MNRVILGNCMEGMAKTPDKYYDLAVVDPDFGLDEKISAGGTWAAKYKKGDGDLGGKPDIEYFEQLFRVSINQIIWGGNYFIDMLFPTRCFIVWDKVAHMDTLADCELAWTSFDKNTKIYKHVRNTSQKRIHICQKPVKLYDWIFKHYAEPGMKVLDTHGGSFSSVISAIRAGMIIDCYEIDKDYYKDGKQRVINYFSQLDAFQEQPEISWEC